MFWITFFRVINICTINFSPNLKNTKKLKTTPKNYFHKTQQRKKLSFQTRKKLFIKSSAPLQAGAFSEINQHPEYPFAACTWRVSGGWAVKGPLVSGTRGHIAFVHNNTYWPAPELLHVAYPPFFFTRLGIILLVGYRSPLIRDINFFTQRIMKSLICLVTRV